MTTNYWDARPIAPQPALAELRKLVLSRSEKRSPKWKFRLAPDLVVQIQAKLLAQGIERFQCLAIMRDDATGQMLTMPRKEFDRDIECWRLGFEIRADVADAWYLKPCSLTRRGPRGPRPGRLSTIDGALRICDRLVGAFQSTCFGADRSFVTVLQPNCLCCGKGLTDPVSMARMIGPECFGSQTEALPYTFKLETPPAKVHAGDRDITLPFELTK
jgi:hypothetical protein